MPAAYMIDSTRRYSWRLGRDPVARREETFAALYEAQFDRVYAFARFRTADAAVAEDIAAEVFARAWSKLRDPAEADAATAWLFTTARRLVVDHYRRPSTEAVGSMAESAHPSSSSPEDEALSSERLAVLARSMAGLTDREREIIGLRFVARLRNREVGSLVRTSEGNVAKILHRALGKLRERLTAEGYTASNGLEERSIDQ
jgi:RNA polymerase sigma-70 factor (ECF subfamily)